MKGSIPRPFIDDLLTKSDIVDVINTRVKLKKAGRDYQACCPFHHEKTPSFTVSQKKQFYHCFGCGAHGNAISFLMDYDKLEFIEAIEELAAMAGLEIPYEKRVNHSGKPQANYQTKRNLYELCFLQTVGAKNILLREQNRHVPIFRKCKSVVIMFLLSYSNA